LNCKAAGQEKSARLPLFHQSKTRRMVLSGRTSAATLHLWREIDSINRAGEYMIMTSERSRYAAAVWATVVSMAIGLPSDAMAEVACTGHQLLPDPRPASSCERVPPSLFPSPDGARTALVLPVDPSLHATPDMESRVDITARGRHIRASKDYSSPGGANGYYVVQATWTPDSQFFVYSLSSSGGHSPWQSPIALYSRTGNTFVSFSDLIGGDPTLSANFKIIGAHSIVATTWRNRNVEQSRKVTVNLRKAMSTLPARP
jgi:hypothetical protein